MVTVGVDSVSIVVSALVRATVTPPGPAGVPRVTGKATDCVGPTLRLVGSPMTPGLSTVTLAVVSGINGDAFTWITEVPATTPVTGTVTVEFPFPGRNVT